MTDVVAEVQKLLATGTTASDIAVLYVAARTVTVFAADIAEVAVATIPAALI